MAKGKSKSSSSGSSHKKHGPKKKMWHCWDSTTRLHFAQAGLLTKYSNKESFEQAVSARGIRTSIDELWAEFCRLAKEVQKVWFKEKLVRK